MKFESENEGQCKFFMYSHTWPSKGCHCCEKAEAVGADEHWDIYQTKCPDYIETVSVDGINECKVPECDNRSIVLIDGTCKTCENYEAVVEDGKVCKIPTCEVRERIDIDGSCKICPDHKVILEDKYECVSP